MKTATKKPASKIFYTPETIGGPCMTGRFMTKEEEKKVIEWAAKHKAETKAKQAKAKN